MLRALCRYRARARALLFVALLSLLFPPLAACDSDDALSSTSEAR
jgi:hypothetical protein